ncbi:hypothetical protein INR75_08555 [Zunongwangia sp. SCSIO 43204]|uniref:hypothetical protein n=1 Tax=Zunongwangia sp. SCSIO 43204 TaxID=2779359 RepID=UPI001CAA3268|nr:hypothetical protein [Zunongwangia sp. SCSIO 43204]UAB86030.1 hypothetical protein INR75_08555 [Zunongwangia sp. SCSIO 43204]
MNKITTFLDEYLEKSNRKGIGAVEANELLAKSGILKDNESRAGKPLRDLLRKGNLPHAFQMEGKGSSWIIPHSNNNKNRILNHLSVKRQTNDNVTNKTSKKTNEPISTSKLKIQLDQARNKYKPEKVKYLLIAEAPPDNLERFFYYENVSQHDYLFLGIAEALFPVLKNQFIDNGRKPETKEIILRKFQQEGFYLLDFSELPLSLLESDLKSQLPNLIERTKPVINDDTHIILIKANVYDSVFHSLNAKFKNVINQRIAFPGQGWQKEFQIKFKEALIVAGI